MNPQPAGLPCVEKRLPWKITRARAAPNATNRGPQTKKVNFAGQKLDAFTLLGVFFYGRQTANKEVK